MPISHSQSSPRDRSDRQIVRSSDRWLAVLSLVASVIMIGSCERSSATPLNRQVPRVPATILESKVEPIIEMGPIPPRQVVRLFHELPESLRGAELEPQTSCECLQVEVHPALRPHCSAFKSITTMTERSQCRLHCGSISIPTTFGLFERTYCLKRPPLMPLPKPPQPG